MLLTSQTTPARHTPGLDISCETSVNIGSLLYRAILTSRSLTSLLPSPCNQEQSSKLKERPKSTVYYVCGSWDGFRDICPICEEEHSVYQCSTFKGWNVSRRLSAAKEKKLFINRLGRGHSLEMCHNKHTCKDCSGLHHGPVDAGLPSVPDGD